jgi:hypothetical protein
MPAKSEAQRRALNAKFGHAWVKRHHFDNAGPLPARVGGKRMSKKMSHHGGHHSGKGSGHSGGKKSMGRVGGHNGHAHGAGRHLNHTSECSKGACGPSEYFQGTNEHQYK